MCSRYVIQVGRTGRREVRNMKHMSNASCDEKKLKKVDLGAAEIAD